jgi:hypothetical protein
MNKSILHLATDEKFIDSANWQFEQVFSSQNDFLVFVPNRAYKLKYITADENVELVYQDELEFDLIVEKLNTYNVVVLHGLDFLKSKIVLASQNNVKFLWMFWGAEIYSNPKVPLDNVIGNQSKKAFFKSYYIEKLKGWFRPLFYSLKHNSEDRFSLVLTAAKRIQLFGTLYKEDYDLLVTKKVLLPSCSYVKASYYPIEFLFKESTNLTVNDVNIMVGNSSSITNNHIEVMSLLSRLDIGTRKVIVPLSYGDKNYAKNVAKKSKYFLGKNFKAITDFVPLQEYNLMLQSCGIVIMNHYRQQAIGTVLGMLWMGARVFLSNKSTLYHYLIRIGILVNCIETELNTHNTNRFTLLSKKEKENNKSILIKEIGFESLAKYLKNDIGNLI